MNKYLHQQPTAFKCLGTQTHSGDYYGSEH